MCCPGASGYGRDVRHVALGAENRPWRSAEAHDDYYYYYYYYYYNTVNYYY